MLVKTAILSLMFSSVCLIKSVSGHLVPGGYIVLPLDKGKSGKHGSLRSLHPNPHHVTLLRQIFDSDELMGSIWGNLDDDYTGEVSSLDYTSSSKESDQDSKDDIS